MNETTYLQIPPLAQDMYICIYIYIYFTTHYNCGYCESHSDYGKYENDVNAWAILVLSLRDYVFKDDGNSQPLSYMILFSLSQQ